VVRLDSCPRTAHTWTIYPGWEGGWEVAGCVWTSFKHTQIFTCTKRRARCIVCNVHTISSYVYPPTHVFTLHSQSYRQSHWRRWSKIPSRMYQALHNSADIGVSCGCCMYNMTVIMDCSEPGSVCLYMHYIHMLKVSTMYECAIAIILTAQLATSALVRG